MEFDYGVLVSVILTWAAFALIGAIIVYFIVRLAVSHGLRAHDKQVNASTAPGLEGRSV